jgi:hypothetical protein
MFALGHGAVRPWRGLVRTYGTRLDPGRTIHTSATERSLFGHRQGTAGRATCQVPRAPSRQSPVRARRRWSRGQSASFLPIAAWISTRTALRGLVLVSRAARVGQTLSVEPWDTSVRGPRAADLRRGPRPPVPRATLPDRPLLIVKLHFQQLAIRSTCTV